MKNAKDLKEIYRTPNGCIYQSDAENCFWIEFAGDISSFKVLCFFALKRRVDAVDIFEMITNPSRSSDVEIIAPCGSQRCYVLSIEQVLEFKELLEGTKVMLELNSILRERLYTVSI